MTYDFLSINPIGLGPEYTWTTFTTYDTGVNTFNFQITSVPERATGALMLAAFAAAVARRRRNGGPTR